MKKNIKRILIIMLAVVMFSGTSPLAYLCQNELFIVKADATTAERKIVDSGNCGPDVSTTYEVIYGDNLKWTLYDDGELYITGSGEMYDWEIDYPPWVERIDGRIIKHLSSDDYDSFSRVKSVTIGEGVTSIGVLAFAAFDNITKITVLSNSILNIGDEAFFGCDNLDDVYYTGTKEEWNAIIIGNYNECLTNATIHYNYVPKDRFYNLGEETYSFENFSDSHADGHCFGMAVTSSAYHLNLLDVSYLGIDSSELNSMELELPVKKPICHYQEIQGTYKSNAFVSELKWSDAVSYVKNHAFDNIGSLIVDTWIDDWHGHSVNFLYYKNVNGQDRIYVYDNNYPDIETYYYQDNNGYIQQAPESTFNTGIIKINIIDMFSYIENAEKFEPKRIIYTEGTNITINGVEGSPMTGATGEETKYMFEIPEGVEQITITPLVDNAKFEYLGETYSFGLIKEDTVGVFTLAESDDASGDFTIENPGENLSLLEAIIVLIKLMFEIIFFPILIWFA